MKWINLAQNRDSSQPRVNTVGLLIRYINQQNALRKIKQNTNHYAH